MAVTGGQLSRLFALTSRSHTPRLQLAALNQIIHALRPTKYLEVGAFEGRSLLLYSALASIHAPGQKLLATSIDSWEGGDEHREAGMPMSDIEKTFDHVAELSRDLTDQMITLEKIRSFSREGLHSIASRSEYYDLILIDASHKASDVLGDLVNAWPLLREGGIMILDDYTWLPRHHTANNGIFLHAPKMAIDAFCGCYADEVTIISNLPLLQLYLAKVSPSTIKAYYFALPEVEIPAPFKEAGIF